MTVNMINMKWLDTVLQGLIGGICLFEDTILDAEHDNHGMA